MDLLGFLKQNPFLLAPMAGITTNPYRTFMRENGCGILTTELISATGIEYKNEKTHFLAKFSSDQRPVGVQLFGDDPEFMASAACFVEEQGADFVDINFGCPVNKVVKRGGGSAALRDLNGMEKILLSVRKAVNLPITIKIRTGWDQHLRNADRVTQLAYDCGITWVCIHGRTRAQGYTGQADWDYITEIKASSKVPVIGNGDILTAEQALSRLKSSGCDGVMIGRGSLNNPWIFSDCMKLFSPGYAEVKHHGNYSVLFSRLHELLARDLNEYKCKIQLRKFAVWYSHGFPESAKFRRALFELDQINDVLECAHQFFATSKITSPSCATKEIFLMSGHG